MGREVKRVHLDFDWFETHKKFSNYSKKEYAEVWYGYILDSVNCELCKGTGKNSKGKTCPACYGDGKDSPKIEPPKDYDEEENGYQIWETVSEGSPDEDIYERADKHIQELKNKLDKLK